MDAEDILPSDAPRPRLCHLRKRPGFDGYGFNLHAEKGRTGQFVGKVDHGSPAELAGLREGDRIVEVNGVAVGAETHAQVVERVKALPGETRFLVVDSAADEYYRERGMTVRADMVVGGGGAHHHEESHHHDANGTDLKYRPRLCHLKIWPDFTGYGFNLHAEKDKAVQYIGKVDIGSPAAAAGLREHDRIVEVNGFNVSTESHLDVVKRIKSDPKQVTLLVVDQEADAHFKSEGVVPTSHLPSVERIVCPDQNHGHVTAAKQGVLYRPRLCHVKARGDGKGYGFNLQAEKGKPGQFIGKVDPDSPADDAGLRDGDRLIEVNGINVEKESHKEVVERIKMIPNKTTMLVIDRDGYEHYVAKGVMVTQALLDGDDSDHERNHKNRESENGKSNHHDSDEDDREIDELADEIANIAKDAEKQDSLEHHAEKKPDKAALSLNVTSASGHHGSSSSSTTSPLESPKSPVVVGGIEFAGTAEEARKKMSKKRNVKETNMSVKAKYDLFQKL